MKSLFVDKSKDFFEILSLEKRNWPSFYFEYIKNAPMAFKTYHSLLGVDRDKIVSLLTSMERRYLDKCYRSISNLKPYEYEAARFLINFSEKNSLDLSKVRVYIVGGLDLGEIFKLDEYRIFTDVLSLYKVGFSNLPFLIVKAFAHSNRDDVERKLSVAEKGGFKKMSDEKQKYVCTLCGYVYDPEKGDPDNGVKPGTPFSELPDDWVCPDCGAPKDSFEPVD